MTVSGISNSTYKNFQLTKSNVKEPPKANDKIDNKKVSPKIPTHAYLYSIGTIGLLTGAILIGHKKIKGLKNEINVIEKEKIDLQKQKQGLENESLKFQEQIKELNKKEKPVGKPIEKPAENHIEPHTEKPIEKPAEKNINQPQIEDKQILDSKKTLNNLFEKLEKNPTELKDLETNDTTRKKFFKDFDMTIGQNNKDNENHIINYLADPKKSNEAKDQIYKHLENDYNPSFDSLINNLYDSKKPRTLIPALRIMTKRGNTNDVSEIQKIMKNPHTADMIHANIAVGYTKLPKERFDKDIIPIFDELYANKKVSLLRVFETHPSKEYVPHLEGMSKIEGLETYIYGQIDHAKNSCMAN